jgi:hypothetical protein
MQTASRYDPLLGKETEAGYSRLRSEIDLRSAGHCFAEAATLEAATLAIVLGIFRTRYARAGWGLRLLSKNNPACHMRIEDTEGRHMQSQARPRQAALSLSRRTKHRTQDPGRQSADSGGTKAAMEGYSLTKDNLRPPMKDAGSSFSPRLEPPT